VLDRRNIGWALDRINTVLDIHGDMSSEGILALREYAGISDETVELIVSWTEDHHGGIDPMSVYVGALVAGMAVAHGSEQ
jgi:hypothetical protein